MFRKVLGAVAALALWSVAASAATLSEADFGEFGDRFDAPTNFTGFSTIVGQSKGQEDFEYFRFDSFRPGATGLDFALKNSGGGSNMLIRLSATPFIMAEWDWTIDEFDAGNMQARELYANEWAPEDTYSFLFPDGFDGPLYGFARFYRTNSESSFSINQIGAEPGVEMPAVPVPGALPLMLAGIGAIAVLSRTRRKAA